MMLALFRKILSVLGILLIVSLPAPSMDTFDPRSISTSTINIDVGAIDLQDPPFYLIETEDGKIIYILGSIHPLPITHALTARAYQELERIIQTKPMYITEHSSSNEINLSSINKGITGRHWIDNHLITHENKELFLSMKDEYINIDMERKSDHLKMGILEHFDPWIVLPIMTMHIGTILKRKFSSFEHSMLKIWGEHLSPERYLEEHEGTLSILQESAEAKFHYNIGGINYFLELLLTANNYETDHMSQQFWKSQFIRYIGNYKWQEFHKTEKEDDSTTKRNHTWVPSFLEKYYPHGNTFLIVVGLGHLEGPENFILILLSKLQIKGNIKRFSNSEGWVDLL